ncbi:hypothetical protein V8J88_24320 [Massilia sp. W12]|uniref:hypothetical protein n=1 Tax=Massilia sp. W12 TaxID=3126507 RepID=UPI0030CC4373
MRVILLSLLLLNAAHVFAACPPPLKPVSNPRQAQEVAQSAIQECRLSRLPPACVRLFVQSAPAFWLVDVREQHDAQCGGDPDTAPRLFSLQIWRDGRVLSDAASMDGSFLPLTRAAS